MLIEPATGHCGAEIREVDLNALTDSSFTSLQDALFTHGVIFLRDQSLSPEAHVALAQRFGEIDINRFFTAVKGHPEIAEVRTKASQKNVIGAGWHSDHSYDTAPAMCSILAARELPTHGGDTLFASAGAAYDNLSDGLRATLEGLKAWHSDGSFASSKIFDQADMEQAVTKPSLHPVVVKHPQTGRKVIFVNGDFTTHFDGWTAAESAPLLAYLYRYISQPAFMCRFRWSQGAVAIWDNRLVQHLAVADYQGQARLMHRVTVKGQPLG